MDPQILSPASYGNRAPQKKKKPKKPSAELPSRHSTRSDENSGKIEPGTEHMSSGQRKNLKLLKSDERARVIDARAVLDSAQKHLATLLKNGGKGGDEDIDELIFNREAEIPVEPIRKGKCPFYFDQRILTIVGRVGEVPVQHWFAIYNTSPFPYMFKIKCSDNSLFKIHPVCGVLDALCDAEISVTFVGAHVPPRYTSYLSIHSMLPDPLFLDVPQAFRNRRNFETRQRLYVEYAYHEDPILVTAEEDRDQFHFQYMRKVLKTDEAESFAKKLKAEKVERLDKKIDEIKARKIDEKLIEREIVRAESPKFEPKTRRLRVEKFFNQQKQKKENEWMEKLKVDASRKPMLSHWDLEMKNIKAEKKKIGAVKKKIKAEKKEDKKKPMGWMSTLKMERDERRTKRKEEEEKKKKDAEEKKKKDAEEKKKKDAEDEKKKDAGDEKKKDAEDEKKKDAGDEKKKKDAGEKKKKDAEEKKKVAEEEKKS